MLRTDIAACTSWNNSRHSDRADRTRGEESCRPISGCAVRRRASNGRRRRHTSPVGSSTVWRFDLTTSPPAPHRSCLFNPRDSCVDAGAARSRSEVADSDRPTAREDSGNQASSRSWPASGRQRPRSAVRRPEPDSRHTRVYTTAVRNVRDWSRHDAVRP